MRKAIGIDIGGTKIAIALVQQDGLIVKKIEIASLPSSGGEDILSRIANELQGFIDDEVIGIGVGSAGQIGLTGEVLSATATFQNWKGVNIKSWLEKATGHRVKVINDVQAMGLGELHVGQERNSKNFICVALGTGVGGAIVSEGKLVRGQLGAAGEFGHMILYPGGRSCPCGNKGCFEAHASGVALEAIYQERFKEIKKGHIIFKEALENDKKACTVIDLYIDSLVIGLTSLVSILNPEKVLLGGGGVSSLLPYVEDITIRVRENVSHINKDVRIEISSLGGDAMLIGAASLLWA